MEEWWGEGESPLDHNARHAVWITIQVSIVWYVEIRRKKHNYVQYGYVLRFYHIFDKIRAYMLKSHAIKQCGLIWPEEKAAAKSGWIVTAEAIDKYVLIVTKYDIDKH